MVQHPRKSMVQHPPVNGAAVDDGRELTQAVSEGVPNGGEAQDLAVHGRQAGRQERHSQLGQRV